jgi:glycosyltransferase involved in cell wall biosynthesis
MSDPTFSVLLPVNRTPELLPFAIASVLAQERPDLELLIICDGGPAETVAAAEAAAADDNRVRVFSFPKGERHGEAHRHAVLQQARGRMVCQIADDDLWFPEHLSEINTLLDEVEFGHTLHTAIDAGDTGYAIFVDLADRKLQERMLTAKYNVFGPTVTGYRMSTYRRMPVGWSPAPIDLWTDLAMWRKFLVLPDIVVGTRIAVSSLHFPNSARQGWSIERRRAEIERYAGLARSPQWRDGFRQCVLRRAALAHVAHERRHDEEAAEQDRLRAALEALSRERARLEFDLANARQASTALDSALEAAAADRASLSTMLARANEEVAAMRARVCEHEQRIHHLQLDQSGLEARMAEIGRAHDAAVARAVTAEVASAALQASLSWRVTAPLRRLGEIGKRT